MKNVTAMILNIHHSTKRANINREPINVPVREEYKKAFVVPPSSDLTKTNIHTPSIKKTENRFDVRVFTFETTSNIVFDVPINDKL